ncbi:thioredoxin family protein [Brevibacillus choshinensis]|uniref:Thioredoxin family protein n=2 Tax=Brevibacillus choshinensis TaxID=54911 RepID=A0ABX7FYH2_BRECH|nr:thioredoxin family protein [Brevibacillus choshinensis]
MRAKWLWMTAVGSLLITVLTAWGWAAASSQDSKIVYVFSDSCGYCQTFRPTLETVLQEYPQTSVERLDIREERDLKEALRLGAEATPTIFVVRDGTVMDKLEGDVPEAVLRSFFQKNLDYPLSGNGTNR